MTTLRYQKTDAGREAIRRRDAELSRPARNLLLILDATRSADEWLAAVAGATPADLAGLVERGYVAVAASRATSAPDAPAPAALLRSALDAALRRLEPAALYDRLTAEARSRLGLVKGYRLVLEIERSRGADELRRLALRVVDELHAADGPDAARGFCRSLGAAV